MASRALLPAAILATLLCAGGLAAAEPVDLELIFAADGSGSIDEEELKLQRDGYADALEDPRVLAAIANGQHRAIAVCYTEWGSATSQHVIVDWAVIRDRASAEAFGAKLRGAPRAATGYNSISGAIDFAVKQLRSNAYEAERQVIDVSADGPHYGGRPVEDARDDALKAGVTINGLVIKTRGGGSYRGPGGISLEQHFELSIIGGPGSFVIAADQTRSFHQAILAKMAREIAAAPGAATKAAHRAE
ncbi:MAG: DUF1194 domain-containing protein [Alphaproteobacteria bacterium]|nr:DUF1194 domain-containing protein [Alphaproteobacteria bacterium]